jgi:hypothetical protein
MSFPNFHPTRIEGFTLPDFGLLTIEDQAGEERRAMQYTGGRDAKLDVFFEGLNESQILELLDFYKNIYSSGRGFGFPPNFFVGQEIYYEALKKSLGQFLLYFTSPPTVKTLYSGVYSIRTQLKASNAFISAPSKIYVTLQTQTSVSAIASTTFVVWSQVSGSPVTFSEPNSLNTVITSQGGVFNTVNGRIILKIALVDNLDVFSLVEIVPSPTSFDALGGLSAYTSFSENPAGLKVIPPLIFSPSDSNGAYFKRKIDIDSIGFRWTLPSQADFLTNFTIEVYNNPNWEPLATTEFNSFTLPAKTTFRITSNYDIGGYKFAVPSEIFYIDPLIHLDSFGFGSDTISDIKTAYSFRESQVLELLNRQLFPESVWDTTISVVGSNSYEDYLPLSSNFLSAESSWNAQVSVIGGITTVTDLNLGGVVIG